MNGVIDLTQDDSDDDEAQWENVTQHTTATRRRTGIRRGRRTTRNQHARRATHNRDASHNCRGRQPPAPKFFKTFLRKAAKSTTVIGDLNIPRHMRIAAALGPKYVYPTRPTITPRDILGAQTAINQMALFIIEKRQREEIHRQLHRALALMHGIYQKKGRSRHPTSPIRTKLAEIYTKTKRFLQENPHILICESDKGNNGVICLKAFVEEKRNAHITAAIQDGTYTRAYDEQSGLQNLQHIAGIHIKAEAAHRILVAAMNIYIEGGTRPTTALDALNLQHIERKSPSGTRYETRTSSTSVHITGDANLNFVLPIHRKFSNEAYSLARLYVSIKVHKGPSYPIRPIIAAPAAIGASIEEWMQRKLEILVSPRTTQQPNAFNMQHIEGCGFIANNSDMVLTGIRSLGLLPEHRIVSLDFVSMYTNIDRQQVRTIIDRQFNRIAARTSMPKTIFMEALDFLLHHNAYFSAGGEILYQQRGLPMGGKLSKVLSEIVTANGTIAAIREAMQCGYSFSFLYKYVDDFIIGMGPDNERTGITLEGLERIFEKHIPGMKVTSEAEKKIEFTWQLKFLEFTTIRSHINDTRVETVWSRQSYASSRVVNGYTDIPTIQKTNTIAEIFRKALRYSTASMQAGAVRKATDWILGNGYTMNTILATLNTIPEFTHVRSRIFPEYYPNGTSNAPPSTVNERQQQRQKLTCIVCQAGFRSRNAANTLCGTCMGAAENTANSSLTTARQIAEQGGRVIPANILDDHLHATGMSQPRKKIPRLGPNTAPASYTPVNLLSPALSENHPLYIQVPAIKNLDTELNGILARWGIDTRFAACKSSNGLFSNIKDRIDPVFDSMVTFAVHCRNCQKMIFFNALDKTVMSALDQCTQQHYPDHELTLTEPRIIAKHPTKARAEEGLKILRKLNLMDPRAIARDAILRDLARIIGEPHAEDD